MEVHIDALLTPAVSFIKFAICAIDTYDDKICSEFAHKKKQTEEEAQVFKAVLILMGNTWKSVEEMM